MLCLSENVIINLPCGVEKIVKTAQKVFLEKITKADTIEK